MKNQKYTYFDIKTNQGKIGGLLIMIKVQLVGMTNKDALDLMSFAARTCYENSEPEWGKQIDIEKRIFDTAHHTILQSSVFIFFIENIAISNVTFGLHLNAPFYIATQRSGRFCFGMFSDPAVMKNIVGYIKYFFPQTEAGTLGKIERYINWGRYIFNENIDSATEIAAKFIAQERPRATKEYVRQNAKKFGQEQLRVLIPTIFPTGLTYTINLSFLIALYRAAWDMPMYYLTDLMAQEVLKLYPELEYMFKREEKSPTDISPIDVAITVPSSCRLQTRPKLELLSVDDLNNAVYPKFTETHPVDTLHFEPRFMPNNTIDIETQIEISMATMGQDQRHRTIRRGPFNFTGGIYSPPIVQELGIDKELLGINEAWLGFSPDLHPALFRSIAPYGAMVSYTKKGTLNAILHEQSKRLCWCTQEEIYHISRLLRQSISKNPGCSDQLLKILSPRCFQCGQCNEGKRYCGRNLQVNPNDFFPERKV